MNSIGIPTNKGLYEVTLQNIVRIQSISNYSKIYFADKRHPLTVAKVLQWFEEALPGELFLQPHRTHLVNKQHITWVAITEKTLQLSTGESIGISKRRKRWVKERLHS